MPRRDDELDEEIRGHLDMAVRDRVERGAPRAEAEAAARREFGNVALVKEVTREMWGWMWLERILQDLRYGGRLLRRNPGFTAVAVLSLGLGIGANAAIFQVINAVGLRLLPVADAARLVEIRIADMTGARGNFSSRYATVNNPVWQQIARDQRAFSGVLAWSAVGFNLGPGGLARRARGLWVSGGFFDVLGVRPAAGRLLSPADDRRGCAPRAVVSHTFWQRELGAGPDAVGSALTLDGHPVEIVGVSARGFFGVVVGRDFDVAVPICAEPLLSAGPGRLDSGTDWWLTLMGRLKPEWTLPRAFAHLAAISPGVFRATLPPTYPAANVKHYLGFRLEAVPGGSGMSGLREDYGGALWLLLGTAALVLVIACANLASLMLARASAREREFAVRLGLGASRGRVFRQLLVESLLLAAIGAACGGFLADILSRSLVSFLDTADQSVVLEVGADWRVLAFTAGVGLLTCVLFGLAPALRSTRVGTGALTRGGGRGLTAGRERSVLRRALVTAQVALSLLLLVGALLFARTLVNLLNVDPGFRPEGVVVVQLDMRPMRVAKEGRHALHAEVLARVRSVAGVRSAAEVWIVPVSGDAWGNNVWMEGADSARTTNALFNRVSGRYFETLGIPLIAGRDFTDADTIGTPAVAVVNETFARMLAAGANPVGRRFRVEATPSRPETAYEIVGLVRDAKYLDLRQEPSPVIFLSTGQAPQAGEFARIVARSDLAPAAATGAITRAIAGLSPSVVVSFDFLKTQIRDTLVRERLMASLSGFFGGVAALLAVVGLYGVIAYTVARRTNEIGVRIALGAGRRDVLRMILREAIALVAVGIGVGLGLALASGRAAASLLFELKPYDPLTLAAAAGALAAVALAASYLPARAAARIEPTVALRID